MAEAIQINGLCVAYDELVALRNIELAVAEGEFICLLGPSGCGKSTLLNAVAGFVKPTAGSISVLGKPVVEIGRAHV